jgi:hypothetical protein
MQRDSSRASAFTHGIQREDPPSLEGDIMSGTVAPGRTSHRAVVFAAFAASLTLACGGLEDPGAITSADEQALATATTTDRLDRLAATSAAAETSPDACVASGAHASHDFAVGCVLCHACGGVYEMSALTLPRGTSTAGGAVIRDASGTTCTVACHSQSGPPYAPVSWTAGGPLACSSCHDSVAPTGAIRSAHVTGTPGDPMAERAGCQGCHVTQDHLSGTVRITDGEGGSVAIAPNEPAQLTAACKTCHDGAGAPIGGQTPPLLVGFESATGDFHGTRVGVGFGGSLAPPYSRGEPPIACTVCHSAHASANDFMLAETVNGMTIPAGVIDRAGVGGELLCEACHEGPRHDQCAGCHGADPMPAGSPCFACHGHEGILTFPQPWRNGQVIHEDRRWSCTHCHSPGWMPTVEYAPPQIFGAITVTNVTGSTATIGWNTDEPATTYVEFGEGTTLGEVVGNAAYATTHAVPLTGLEPATTYSFRVRTSDRMRNVRLSAVQTFGTANPLAPPAPTVVPAANVLYCDTGSAPASFRWNAVASPTGYPVQYRVVVDDSTAFTEGSLTLDSGWRSETDWTVVATLPPEPVKWYWRVTARDSVTGASGPPSNADDIWIGDMTYVGGCGD